MTKVEGRSLAVFGVDDPRKASDLLDSKGLDVVTRSRVETGDGPSTEEVAEDPDERVDGLDYYLGGTYFW